MVKAGKRRRPRGCHQTIRQLLPPRIPRAESVEIAAVDRDALDAMALRQEVTTKRRVGTGPRMANLPRMRVSTMRGRACVSAPLASSSAERSQGMGMRP